MFEMILSVKLFGVLEFVCGRALLEERERQRRRELLFLKATGRAGHRLLPTDAAQSCTKQVKWLATPPVSKIFIVSSQFA